ncbi:MAG: ATP-binding cassette domain-containing protein, partial [Gammaproteobacteria bacterium]|nr:ATP-binding cassette domain-containing protein [Gammaproteobacteria bacterium]
MTSISTDTPASNDAHAVIKCDSVFKIFGEQTADLMRKSGGQVNVDAFKEAGCIFGVNNASFEVHKGEMLVIMGLSGSGKSTLLRCISKLTDTTAGNIHIDGEDLLAMKPKELIELR